MTVIELECDYRLDVIITIVIPTYIMLTVIAGMNRHSLPAQALPHRRTPLVVVLACIM